MVGYNQIDSMWFCISTSVEKYHQLLMINDTQPSGLDLIIYHRVDSFVNLVYI